VPAAASHCGLQYLSLPLTVQLHEEWAHFLVSAIASPGRNGFAAFPPPHLSLDAEPAVREKQSGELRIGLGDGDQAGTGLKGHLNLTQANRRSARVGLLKPWTDFS
jgi:hypothetical protein